MATIKRTTIYESNTPPKTDNVLWEKGGVLMQSNNGNWEKYSNTEQDAVLNPANPVCYFDNKKTKNANMYSVMSVNVDFPRLSDVNKYHIYITNEDSENTYFYLRIKQTLSGSTNRQIDIYVNNKYVALIKNPETFEGVYKFYLDSRLQRWKFKYLKEHSSVFSKPTSPDYNNYSFRLGSYLKSSETPMLIVDNTPYNNNYIRITLVPYYYEDLLDFDSPYYLRLITNNSVDARITVVIGDAGKFTDTTMTSGMYLLNYDKDTQELSIEKL